MHAVTAENVDHGLQVVLERMLQPGNHTQNDSRNGPVIKFTGLTVIEWTKPQYRVSFDTVRDSNPAFHLFESLWMLWGGNDVKRPQYFASNMGAYSDDGKTYNGAYGHRWVHHFGIDQLREYVIPALRANREDRRVVLQMWDSATDPAKIKAGTLDVPCNLLATFDAANGKLDMSVMNRSNDTVWGATGANAVHFSVLQEYIATACGFEMGSYYQISSNMHLYTELNPASKRVLERSQGLVNPEVPKYNGSVSSLKSQYDTTEGAAWQEEFDSDTRKLMETYNDVVQASFKTAFFCKIVLPVIHAFNLYKNNDYLEEAVKVLEDQPSEEELPQDWIVATKIWMQRRIDTRNKVALASAGVKDRAEFFKQVQRVWRDAKELGNAYTTGYGGTMKQVALFSPESENVIKPRGQV